MTPATLPSNPGADQTVDPPELIKLQTAVLHLLELRVLSKGGAMPSEEALRAVCRTLAERALRARDAKREFRSN